MGGKAFSDIERIERERIPGVIAWLQEQMGTFPYELLGSTGKGPTSGDVDLALNLDYWGLVSDSQGYWEFVDKLKRILGHENVNTQGHQFGQIYTRFAIVGPPVQVDFIIGDPKLLSFTHWSPAPHESNYSGTHRTEYLKAIAKTLSKVIKIDNQVVARVGFTLHHNVGLEYSARWCKPRVDGSGFTKKMVHVGETDMLAFKKAFPNLRPKKHAVEADPGKICQKLFGKSVNHSMVNTYENIASIIKITPKLYDSKDLIWNLYTERLLDIRRSIPERLV